MFHLCKPSGEKLQRIRDAYRGARPSYPEVGQTRGELPPGYKVDHHCIQLGTGRATFERAKQLLAEWRGFELGWLGPCWPRQTIEEGALVGTLAHVFGLWAVNVCRIVYVEGGMAEAEVGHSATETERFGFAYGTLPGHAERGEERFTVTWNRAGDDAVWYDILAFSRPNLVLTRLGAPLVRRLQKRFALDSMQAMRRAIDGSTAG